MSGLGGWLLMRTAPERAKQLLVEDPEREARRLELVAQAEKLKESLAEVDRFQRRMAE